MKHPKKEQIKRIGSGIFIILVVILLFALITWTPEPDYPPAATAVVETQDVQRASEDSGLIITRRFDGNDTQVVQLFVDEDVVADLSVDQEVSISVDALNLDGAVTGRIDSIADEPRITGDLTEYEAIVVFDDIPDDLRNGMHADTTIVLEKKANVLAVPNDSLYKKDDAHFVDRITQTRRIYLQRLGIDNTTQTIESVRVEIGLEGDDVTEITSGLSDGDVVVAELMYDPS